MCGIRYIHYTHVYDASIVDIFLYLFKWVSGDAIYNNFFSSLFLRFSFFFHSESHKFITKTNWITICNRRNELITISNSEKEEIFIQIVKISEERCIFDCIGRFLSQYSTLQKAVGNKWRNWNEKKKSFYFFAIKWRSREKFA